MENQRARDAELGHEIAKLLEGHVERKVCNKEVKRGESGLFFEYCNAKAVAAILIVMHGG